MTTAWHARRGISGVVVRRRRKAILNIMAKHVSRCGRSDECRLIG
jgi:hypothetical protein